MIVGTLDQSDFPWEDVDLTTAGLQDFALTGSTLDWTLRLNIDGNRAGPGPFATTVKVTLPPGFRRYAPTPVRPAPAALNSFSPGAGTITGPVATDGPDGQVLVWTIADRGRRHGLHPQVPHHTRAHARRRPRRGEDRHRQRCRHRRRCRRRGRHRRRSWHRRRRRARREQCALPRLRRSSRRRRSLRIRTRLHSPRSAFGSATCAGDGDLVVYGPATDRPGNSPSPVPTRTATPATPPLVAEDLDVSGAEYSPLSPTPTPACR